MERLPTPHPILLGFHKCRAPPNYLAPHTIRFSQLSHTPYYSGPQFIWNIGVADLLYNLFRGRSLREVLEFTEELISICKEYIGLPYSMERRCRGVYLLYSVYFKQPLT